MKKSLLMVSLVLVSSVIANNSVVSIDIYKNRTFISQKLDVSSKSIDLLGVATLEDIKFKVDGNCEIKNTSADVLNYSNDEISKQIEEYKQKIDSLANEIKTLEKINLSLETIKYEKESVNLENIKNVSSYIKEELSQNYNNIYKKNIKLRKQNEDLQKLISKKNSNLYSKLYFDIDCKKSSKVLITYPIHNITKNSFYDITADTKTKKVDIKNVAFITQSSGYDFSNISINLFTYNYTSQINPPVFRPKYLDIQNPRKPIVQRELEEIAFDSAVKKKGNVVLSQRPSFSYNQTATKSFFQAKNISLKSGVKTPVVFAKESYEMKENIQIDGYANAKAFYKISFKSNKLFSNSNANLYLDSIFIGKRYINEIKKDKKSYLFFGEDRFIDIKKELVKDMKEKPFFGINKITKEQLWKYTITNNHDKPKSITLVERLPISKNEKIKVKLISKAQFSKKENNGKISYNFTLNPKETKTLEFGYEIQRPTKK